MLILILKQQFLISLLFYYFYLPSNWLSGVALRLAGHAWGAVWEHFDDDVGRGRLRLQPQVRHGASRHLRPPTCHLRLHCFLLVHLKENVSTGGEFCSFEESNWVKLPQYFFRIAILHFFPKKLEVTNEREARVPSFRHGFKTIYESFSANLKVVYLNGLFLCIHKMSKPIAVKTFYTPSIPSTGQDAKYRRHHEKLHDFSYLLEVKFFLITTQRFRF